MPSTRTMKLVSILSLAATAAAATQYCNNSPSLCGRAYNNITHLGAHDAPFVRTSSNDYTPAGDQFYNAEDALSSGVRLLSGQVHNNTDPSTGDTSWDLCHTNCLLYNAGTMTDWLSGIKGWLDANPNDVVTLLIVNSDNADAATLDAQFQPSGIVDYAFVPADTKAPHADQWPTLGDMIAQNKRLVVFIASLDPNANTVAPYLLDEFTHVFENNYDNDDVSSFSCDASRPSSDTAGLLADGHMPLMNHFLYEKIGSIEIPNVDAASDTNSPGTDASKGNLGAAGQSCVAAYGKAPTFVLVDFFNAGPAIAAVDQLNGVQGDTYCRLELYDGTDTASLSSTSEGACPTGGPNRRQSSVAAAPTPTTFATRATAKPSAAAGSRPVATGRAVAVASLMPPVL